MYNACNKMTRQLHIPVILLFLVLLLYFLLRSTCIPSGEVTKPIVRFRDHPFVAAALSAVRGRPGTAASSGEAPAATVCDGIIHDYKCLDRYDFSERLFAEMRLIPPAVMEELPKPGAMQKRKRIVVIDSRHEDPVGNNPDSFPREQCLISQCTYSGNMSQTSLESADVILFRHIFGGIPKFKRPADQIWVLFLLESPFNSPDLTPFKNQFNYTATYRTSSSIFNPYGIYRPHKNGSKRKEKHINYAAGRKKKVAWVVSNCNNIRNERNDFVAEFGKYIELDKMGGCGKKIQCPRINMGACLRDYKFYLSFENSNCRDYITEKFYINALANNLLPIVMGAHPDDYKRLAPPHSYIHVDEFDSPKALAEYLIKLDKDDNLYNEYFKWKDMGDVYPVESPGMYCRLCATLWADKPRTWVTDVNAWWRREGLCIRSGKWPKKMKTDPNDQSMFQRIIK